MAQENRICRAQLYPFAKNQRHEANSSLFERRHHRNLFSGRVLDDQNVGIIAAAVCSKGND